MNSNQTLQIITKRKFKVIRLLVAALVIAGYLYFSPYIYQNWVHDLSIFWIMFWGMLFALLLPIPHILTNFNRPNIIFYPDKLLIVHNKVELEKQEAFIHIDQNRLLLKTLNFQKLPLLERNFYKLIYKLTGRNDILELNLSELENSKDEIIRKLSDWK